MSARNNRTSVAVPLLVLGMWGALTLSACVTPAPSSRQEMVHGMGHEVMPFKMSATQHVFEMTESGGIQQVIARDPNDTAQIGLIRQHLHHEAMRFSSGDFSDPTALHGAEMPGLRELSAGAAQIEIDFSDLPNGAQLTFTTRDLRLITTIHRWFGAQLSDHGTDATYR
jgi:hypothetical protein